ncbi:probable F-actin-capping protein subunit beta, partial [Tanacetum coccineum]
ESRPGTPSLVEDGHLCNMGKMIEELEGKLRNQLDQVYFGKTKEMVCTLRPPSELLSMTLPDSRNP